MAERAPPNTQRKPLKLRALRHAARSFPVFYPGLGTPRLKILVPRRRELNPQPLRL
jgi:hypothetical protein